MGGARWRDGRQEESEFGEVNGRLRCEGELADFQKDARQAGRSSRPLGRARVRPAHQTSPPCSHIDVTSPYPTGHLLEISIVYHAAIYTHDPRPGLLTSAGGGEVEPESEGVGARRRPRVTSDARAKCHARLGITSQLHARMVMPNLDSEQNSVYVPTFVCPRPVCLEPRAPGGGKGVQKQSRRPKPTPRPFDLSSLYTPSF